MGVGNLGLGAWSGFKGVRHKEEWVSWAMPIPDSILGGKKLRILRWEMGIWRG